MKRFGRVAVGCTGLLLVVGGGAQPAWTEEEAPAPAGASERAGRVDYGSGHAIRISGDGTVVTFVSGDQVVAASRDGSRRRIVSSSPAGEPGNARSAVFDDDCRIFGDRGPSGIFERVAPAIGVSGRAVAFLSMATNLLPGSVSGIAHVYVKDLRSGALERASSTDAGVPANGNSYAVGMAGNGRFVAFWSEASNLVPGDTNDAEDLFLKDRRSGRVERLTVDSLGQEFSEHEAVPDGEGGCLDGVESRLQAPALSDDGAVVAFSSLKPLAGAPCSSGEVFVRDRAAGTTTRPYPCDLEESVVAPWLSGDGREVAVQTAAVYRIGGCLCHLEYRPTGRAVFDRAVPGAGATVPPGAHLPMSPTVDDAGGYRVGTSRHPNTTGPVVYSAPAGRPLQVRHRLNAGGPAVRDVLGQAWAADHSFAGGRTFATARPIEHTASDAIYQSHRSGSFSYDLAVPAGTYTVRMHFAETAPCCDEPWDEPLRAFDLLMEGAAVAEDFEPLQVTQRWDFGQYYAFAAGWLDREVTVTDGNLDIDFAPIVQKPMVSGIEVFDR